MKYLGVNLTKYVQDHKEVTTKLMEDIKILNKQRDIPCALIKKTQYCPDVNYSKLNL